MFMCLCVCVSSLFFSFLLFKFVLTPYHHTHSYDTSDLNLLSRMDIKERISSLNMSKQTYRQTHNVLHGCMHACACSFSCKIFILVFARPRQLKERALSFKSLVLVLALNPNFKVEIRQNLFAVRIQHYGKHTSATGSLIQYYMTHTQCKMYTGQWFFFSSRKAKERERISNSHSEFLQVSRYQFTTVNICVFSQTLSYVLQNCSTHIRKIAIELKFLKSNFSN